MFPIRFDFSTENTSPPRRWRLRSQPVSILFSVVIAPKNGFICLRGVIVSHQRLSCANLGCSGGARSFSTRVSVPFESEEVAQIGVFFSRAFTLYLLPTKRNGRVESRGFTTSTGRSPRKGSSKKIGPKGQSSEPGANRPLFFPGRRSTVRAGRSRRSSSTREIPGSAKEIAHSDYKGLGPEMCGDLPGNSLWETAQDFIRCAYVYSSKIRFRMARNVYGARTVSDLLHFYAQVSHQTIPGSRLKLRRHQTPAALSHRQKPSRNLQNSVRYGDRRPKNFQCKQKDTGTLEVQAKEELWGCYFLSS